MIPSTSVVVVLAPQGAVPAAVRDLLRDWVALGLVQPLVWVEAGELVDGAPLSSVVGARLLADDAPRVRLQDHLANQRSIDVVRLVALGSLGAETALVPASVAGHLNTALSAVTPGRVVPLQLLITRHGAGGWEEDVSVPGWRTLVLAPEDSWSPSPSQPSTEFAVGGDEAEFTAHAAAGLASVAGLWTGMSKAAFDGSPGDNGDPVVVRGFLRHLDTSTVTSRLRRALTDVSAGLPLPQSGSTRVEALQDGPQGAADLHRTLVDRHAALFDVRWVQASEVRAQAIGVGAAVRLFLAFLWSSVKSAPADFLDRVKDRGAALVSRQVQDALFGGNDSRYEVITRNVNAAGLPPGVGDLSGVAEEVRERVSHVLPSDNAAVPDTSVFWSDVVAGALSLADAGDHGSDVGPVLVAGDPRVVRDPAVIAPAPSDAFVLSPVVAARLGTARVTPYDTRAQQQAADAMAAAGPADRRSTEDFPRWRQRTTGSFTGLLGARLAQEVEQRTDHLRSLLEQLRTEEGSIDESSVASRLQRVRVILARAVLGLVLIALTVYAVARFDLLDGWRLALTATGLVAAWLVWQVLALLDQQRRVFALVHAQRTADEALELASRNLPVAASALHLATTMYAQYLAWAPVLGRFLREPFGPVAEPPAAKRLQGLLPRAVGFGLAEVDDDRLASAAHDLGSVVFGRGWLQPLWEAFLADAPRQLGPAGLPLRDDPAQLFRDTARSDDSLLRAWSAAVVEHGVPGGAGDALWRRARAELVGRGARALSEELVTHVEVQAQEAHNVRGRLSGREFFTTLTDALGDVDRHYFSPPMFTDLAMSGDRHRVTSTVAIGRSDMTSLGASASSSRVRWLEPAQDDTGLDQFLVVVQSSAAMPGGELTLREPGSARGPHVPEQEVPLCAELSAPVDDPDLV